LKLSAELRITQQPNPPAADQTDPTDPTDPSDYEHEHDSPSHLFILEGRLRQGFKFADIGLYVATDAEPLGSTRPFVSRRRAKGGIPISAILDLRADGYVVHLHHGIGVVRGLVKRQPAEAGRDSPA